MSASARDSLAEVRNGAFVRTASVFRDQVSSQAGAVYPAVAGRYVLYVSYACPWANRALAFLELKGLQDVIEVAVVAPIWKQTKPGVDEHRGWVFDPSALEGCTADPVFGATTMREVYEHCSNFNEGVVKFTVPALLDRTTNAIVNNESSEIIRMFNSEFNALAKNPSVDLCPADKLPLIGELNTRMYEAVNNGVYRCGFATTQEAYETAFKELQDGLEYFENLLGRQRWLCGSGAGDFSESDIRLAMTLFRYDEVYQVHFKCNGKLIRERPALTGWLRDVYQYAGGAVGRTIRMGHIKQHYYGSHAKLNPYGIIPVGVNEDWTLPHGREAVGAETK